MWGSDGFPFGEPMMFPLVLFLFWSLFWKGLALWHAAVRKQSWWFIALLVINTGGLLEIIYLFAIAKVKGKDLFR
ncbi:hypothetical protein HYV70_01295 [Candidatus Uhrbacteria bacterium]|nr:hypothetical protein [Candidatus Uhrbacteria bacterium]